MDWYDFALAYFALWGAASHLFLVGLLLLARWFWLLDRLLPSDEPAADAIDEHETFDGRAG